MAARLPQAKKPDKKFTPTGENAGKAAGAADKKACGAFLSHAACRGQYARCDEYERTDPFAAHFCPVEGNAGQSRDRPAALSRVHATARRGRAAALNPKGRFERFAAEPDLDMLQALYEAGEKPPRLKTEVREETPRRIISRNESDDIPFNLSVNPYRGCEHGCIYCYARATHSYMGLSAGLDFETKLFAKPEAAQLLRRELAHPSYQPQLIALGSNTDPYQPIEKQRQITRSVLEVLCEARHPVSIITKSAMVLRDSDILAAMAREKLVHVALSIETLDAKLARLMDPRAAAPLKRLQAVEKLAALGVPVSVMFAPVIPALNDHEIEEVAAQAAKAGAKGINYAVLRLPVEVAPLFKDWLLREYPDKYRRIISQLRMMRGGRENEAAPRACGRGAYGGERRMRGEGVMAALLARRFQLAAARCGLNCEKIRLTRRLFRVPPHWRAADSFNAARRSARGHAKQSESATQPVPGKTGNQLSLF